MAKPEAGAKKRRRQEDEAEEQDVLAQRLAAYGEPTARRKRARTACRVWAPSHQSTGTIGGLQAHPAACMHATPPAGERFLDMFDDADRRPARAPQPPAADSDSGREGSSGASDSDADGGGSGGSDDEAVPAGQVVEHIFHSGGRPGSSAGARRGAGPAGGAGGMPGTPHQQLAAAEAERLRLERKRFMSSKAAVVTSGGQQPARGGARRPGSATPGGAAAAEADGISREEFLAMQREVQLYG